MRSVCAVLAMWLLLVATASARESCPFVRDPAFWARTPVPAASGDEIAVATFNAFRLFDAERDRDERELPTRGEFAARIQRVARYIVRDLGAPALLGVQEIEDATSAQALAAALAKESGREYRVLTGETSGDSDIRSALFVDARLRVLATESLFARTPRDGKPLHDRLPLVVDVEIGAGTLRVVVVHLRSMRGLDDRDAQEAARVAEKRCVQARELADWSRAQVAAGRRLVVLGDFNATETGADARKGEPLQILRAGSGLVEVAGDYLKPSQRWTYRHGCALDELDRLLVSPALRPAVRGYAIARGDTCLRAKERCDPKHSVSDHEGVVLLLAPGARP